MGLRKRFGQPVNGEEEEEEEGGEVPDPVLD